MENRKADKARIAKAGRERKAKGEGREEKRV